MNKFYKDIMDLKGAEEFKSVIRRWNTLSDNIRSKPMNAPVILPDMLWVARSGVGKTNLLRLMAEYLSSRENLMEFYGDVKFFEFLLNYCPPNGHFSELQRLMDEIDNAAGFRSEFKGIVHIDINEWVDRFEEKHFVSLMEYLSANSDNWLIVLSVDNGDENKIHNLNAFLSMYLRIEKITLSFPKTDDLFGLIEDMLKQYGLTLRDDAERLLFDTIEKLRGNKYFDGYKTVIMLCRDIVYDVFSHESIEELSLGADMLSKFSADSDYINNMIANIERVNRIGLVNRE